MYNFKCQTLIAAIVFLFSNLLLAQVTPKDVDEFLVKGEPQAKVLLVGTFHFSYPGLDTYKTEEKDKVNVLSPKRQAEMEVLVDYIAKFKPTKIVVEGGVVSGYMEHQYKQYKKGKEKLRPKELDQICFRLMDRFGLKKIYGADANGLTRSLQRSKDSTAFKPFLETLYAEPKEAVDETLDERYFDWYSYDDKMALQMTLLEYFKYMNTDRNITRSHGHYLVGDFKKNNHDGADLLTMNWYGRNIRIFRNIQDAITSPDDRVMVLFGAGHMPILHHLFESTPEYELVKFGDLEQY